MNSTTLIGNVGTAPEQRTAGSTNVVSFTLATSERYKDKQGNKKDMVEWHNIEIWGSLTSIVMQYVKKGDKLALQGKINYQSWEHDGKKHYKTVIKCFSMEMLGSKNQDNNTPAPQNNTAPTAVQSNTDELPF